MLTSLISTALREHGDRLAVTDSSVSLTYSELATLVETTARELTAVLPVTGRARVGLLAGNSADYVVLYLALLRVGCVPFLVDSTSGPDETAAVAADCGLDLLLHDPEKVLPDVAVRRGTLRRFAVSALPDQPERPELDDRTEVCRFTSGSTGRPLCIEFSGEAVHRAALSWSEGTGLTGADSIACFASLSNGLAFNTSLLAAFLTGAQLHLGRGLPTAGRVVRMLATSRATRLVGFPALYESLTRRTPDREAFRLLRVAISSAAPLSAETKQQFTALTGVPVNNYYGAAEAGPLTFAADPLHDPGLGQPLPGVSLRAGTGRGEPEPIEVRSASMGTRYLNAPGLLAEKTTADGHYRPGDLGYLDGGSLVLTGRLSQLINVGGRKVDAVQVADVLRRAEGVREAVVLQVTDRHGGNALGAVLAGASSLDPGAVRRHVSGQLAAHKVPTLLRVVPEIPRGSTGKPAMAELRRLFEQPQVDA